MSQETTMNITEDKKRVNIDNLSAHFINDHGYLLLDQFFTDEEIATQTSLIRDTLTESGGIPGSRDEAKKWITAKSKIQRDARLLDIVNKSKLRNYLSKIFPDGIVTVKSCQIASRFPGERAVDNKVPDDWYKEWHIDNFVQARRSQPKEYTLNIGVYLSDNNDKDSGNFTVFPGMHHRVEKFSQKKGGYEYFLEHKLDEMKTTFDLQ